MRDDLQEQLRAAQRSQAYETTDILNQIREVRHLRLQQPQTATSLFPLSASSDAMLKSRLVSMEVQLNAACAAKNDAQLQVEQLSTKLEAAS
ncbi:unnamed protein product, partial [Dibothriocephalus latus]